MLARLGPKLMMLYYFEKEHERYVMKYKIPVIEGHKPISIGTSYDKLDIEASKAIASLISEANGSNPDLTKHLWALSSIWQLMPAVSMVVILEWQPACMQPQAATVGNVIPVASSSMTAFNPFRSSSKKVAGETASILLRCSVY